jgi:hypothetical protein
MNPNQPMQPNDNPPEQPQTVINPTTPSPSPNPAPTPAPVAESQFFQPAYAPPAQAVPQPIAQPAPMAMQQPAGGTNKIVILAIGAVVILALISGGIFIATHKSTPKTPTSNISGSGSTPNTPNSSKSIADVVDRKDGTLDLSSLINPSDTLKNQDLKAKINQQLNLSNGYSFMITGVDRNWIPPTSSYLKVTASNEYIKVNTVFGNRSESGSFTTSSSDFEVINSAGGGVPATFISPSQDPESFDGHEVAAGKQIKGFMIFAVDKNEKISTLKSERDYTKVDSKAGSNIDVSLKTTISL